MKYQGNRNIAGATTLAGRGGSEYLNQAYQAQSAASAQNQVALTGAQIAAEAKKTWAQVQQIHQETRTKVTEMFRESVLNRAKSSSKIHKKYLQALA